VTIVLADEDDFAGKNEEWLKWFPSSPPARLVAVPSRRVPASEIRVAEMFELSLPPWGREST
jgi:2-iminobutanoate/2-iminopropanoate deaminase